MPLPAMAERASVAEPGMRILQADRMSHVRGAPRRPQTQGRIERWHQTMKNGDLEAQIGAYVAHATRRASTT